MCENFIKWKSLSNSVHNDNEYRIVPATIQIVKFFQNVTEDYLPICYNACVVRPTPGNGRGVCVELFLTFLVAVAAGVVCHLISKWPDRHDKGNK